jgi:tryptophan synthase alpha chain
MKAKLQEAFRIKKDLLSIFFTAGFPEKKSFHTILKSLQDAGVDFLEIGMPFSDPIADGPTIQKSNQKAIQNGFTLEWMFEELDQIKDSFKIPFLLMGYINPVVQYGIEKFCSQAAKVGASGVILPDLPIREYRNSIKQILDQYNLTNVFLITPQTSTERIIEIDQLSESFIYMVSTTGTTGARKSITAEQLNYFERIRSLNLKNPIVAGFGISDRTSFQTACSFANGVIVGSAFIKMLEQSKNIEKDISTFIHQFK